MIKNYLLQYVNDKTDPGSFSYILQSWLKNGDDPNYLNSLVINWLKIETNQLTKGYVIKNFIEFGGDLKIIQVQANDWLKDNKESSLSISIIGFWLNRLSEQENNSETLDILKEHVLNVLNKFSSISTTGSVISNWIVKGGDLKLLRPHLNIWLSKYINSTHAEFVISWWMMKGGFPKDVKEFIIPWLSIFGTSKAASELMFSWLNNGYDPSIIENYVQPYLELYSEKFESKYLINACLKAGLSPTLVKDSILPWLNSNGFKTESIYLAANWLSQGKDFTLVEKFIKEKLDKYIESEVDCNLILENWLTSGGDPVIIKSHVNLYLEKYWRHKNAIYLIRRWINATNDSNFVEPYIHRILKFRKKNKRRNNPFVKESFRYLRLIPILKLLQNLKFKFIYHFSEVLQRRITYKIERHLQEGLNPDLIKKK
ncbi:MAG: hypothetical protein IPG86_15705 [Chitinophagaceae bacterium]|nr:hypothetical protein [Chitinophagaceae bacterium]